MCGGVRYEIAAPLGEAGYCHCTRCQRRTGTASSAGAAVEPGAWRLVQGEELLKAYEPEAGFKKVFCSHCGSALYSENPEDSERKHVRLGTLDEPPTEIEFAFRQFVDYAVPWEPLPDDGVPRYRERRPT
jgi:hypothetical protein